MRLFALSPLILGALALVGLAACSPRAIVPGPDAPPARLVLVSAAPPERLAAAVGTDGGVRVSPYLSGARAEWDAGEPDPVPAALEALGRLDAEGFGSVFYPLATYPEGAPACVRPDVLFGEGAAAPLPARRVLDPVDGPGVSGRARPITVWVQVLPGTDGEAVCTEAVSGLRTLYGRALAFAAERGGYPTGGLLLVPVRFRAGLDLGAP